MKIYMYGTVSVGFRVGRVTPTTPHAEVHMSLIMPIIVIFNSFGRAGAATTSSATSCLKQCVYGSVTPTHQPKATCFTATNTAQPTPVTPGAFWPCSQTKASYHPQHGPVDEG